MVAEPTQAFAELLTEPPRPTSASAVVERLREVLLSGQVRRNQKLPSERQLVALLGISRATVREALRTLEAQGLLSVRLGGSGGAFFVGPNPGHVGRALSMLLLLDSATEKDLTDFRIPFEQENAALAAARATEEGRAQLRLIAQQADELDPDHPHSWMVIKELDLALHELLPALTGNGVRLAISSAIHEALLRSVADVKPSSDSTGSLRIEVADLARLVAAGDQDGARLAMAAHMRRWRD